MHTIRPPAAAFARASEPRPAPALSRRGGSSRSRGTGTYERKGATCDHPARGRDEASRGPGPAAPTRDVPRFEPRGPHRSGGPPTESQAAPDEGGRLRPRDRRAQPRQRPLSPRCTRSSRICIECPRVSGWPPRRSRAFPPGRSATRWRVHAGGSAAALITRALSKRSSRRWPRRMSRSTKRPRKPKGDSNSRASRIRVPMPVGSK